MASEEPTVQQTGAVVDRDRGPLVAAPYGDAVHGPLDELGGEQEQVERRAARQTCAPPRQIGGTRQIRAGPDQIGGGPDQIRRRR